jgi:hypothetical protein
LTRATFPLIADRFNNKGRAKKTRRRIASTGASRLSEKKAGLQKRSPARVNLRAKPVGPVVQANKVQPKKSGWQKFLDGLKKALGIGSKLAEFVLPLIGKPGIDGSLGPVLSCTHSCASRIGTTGMVGLAQPLKEPGMARPVISTTSRGYSFIHSGIIGEVSIPGSTKRGDQLLRVDLTPSTLETWLSAMANFEKYRFKNIVVTYVPMCAATEPGAVCGFFEWDVDNPLSVGQGEDSLKDAMAHYSSMLSGVWSPFTCHFNSKEEPTEEWYVGSAGVERRLATQGTFTLIAASDFDDALEAGQLMVAYEIEFFIPEVRSNLDGHWTHHRSLAANNDEDNPFGTEPGHFLEYPVYYEDPISGALPVGLNASLKQYFHGTPAVDDYSMQLEEGFWIVAAYATGCTAITAWDLETIGAYQILESAASVDINWSTINAAATDAITWALIFSSGLDAGALYSTVPTNAFKIACTATGVGNTYIAAAYLHGHPQTYYSNASMADKLKQLMMVVKEMGGDFGTVLLNKPTKTLTNKAKQPSVSNIKMTDSEISFNEWKKLNVK